MPPLRAHALAASPSSPRLDASRAGRPDAASGIVEAKAAAYDVSDAIEIADGERGRPCLQQSPADSARSWRGQGAAAG